MSEIILVMCATESNHDFSNLRSYNNLVDSVFILDSGLSEKNLMDICSNLTVPFDIKTHKFEDFEIMRNEALNNIPDDCIVIEIDDSWELDTKLNKKDILQLMNNDIDVLNTEIKDNGLHYRVNKIFRNNFNYVCGAHSILLLPEGTSVKKTELIKFIDRSPNFNRSKKRTLWGIQKMEEYLTNNEINDKYILFNLKYRLAKMYMLNEDSENAIKYFENILKNKQVDLELSFNAYIFLTTLKQDINYLFHAINIYPLRRYEAYYCIYQLTRNPDFLNLSKETLKKVSYEQNDSLKIYGSNYFDSNLNKKILEI